MGYREEYFKYDKGILIPGKSGRQYRCKRCGDYFPKSGIDVDHIISKRKGGTDDIYNLQSLCIHCNRSKGKNTTGSEMLGAFARAVLHDGVSGAGNLAKGMASRKVKDAFGIKYKR